MELKYISYNKSKHKNDIKKMYINSFMKAERFPFWLLKYCSKEKMQRSYALLHPI